MHSMPPVPARHALMDAGRGFAILGILWLNIFIFAIPYAALAIPGTWGGGDDPLIYLLNVETWRMVGWFVDGVMRGMISILFGASALVMMTNAERAGAGLAALDPYYRRLLWLIAFGLVHAYLLLWPYDILYLYGLFGLLLFPFRNLKSRTLMIIAAVMILLSMLQGGAEYAGSLIDATDQKVASMAAEPGAPKASLIETFVSDDEGYTAPSGMNSEEAQQDQDFKQLMSDIEDEINARSEGYLSNMVMLAPQSFVEQTSEVFSHHFLDVVPFMLLGIALLKNGFLTGAWSARRYLKVAVVGYSVGMVLGYVANTAFPDGSAMADISDLTAGVGYDPRRLAFALAHFSTLALLLNGGRARWFTRSLEACGRLALTLYISQTVTCIFLFYGFGFGLFGSLDHIRVALIAAIMTLVQFVVAPLYLRFFDQGPLERLIRWLIGKKPVAAVVTAPASAVPVKVKAR